MSRKTAPEKKQRAELRVFFRSEEGTALVMFVEVRGRDIYAGASLGTKQFRMRSTYHESGQRHMHTPVGRFSRRQDEPTARVSGWTDLFQTTTASTDWATPKPDTERRLALTITEEECPDGACIMAVAVESERSDITDAFLDGAPFQHLGVDVVGHLVADWVSPTVIVLALRMQPRHVAAIRAGIARDGGDSTEKLHGFILGPPNNPSTLTWTTLGRVEADGTITQFAPTDS